MKNTYVLAVVATVSLLAACAGSKSPADETLTPSPSASPDVTAEVSTPSASEAPSPTSEPTAAVEASFLDVNGRWCPADTSVWAGSCVVIDLPALRFDGFESEEYAYLPSHDVDADPRTYVAADFNLAPTTGECWAMAVDGYPPASGAWLTFCPAGATSGEDWIDDPGTYFAENWGEDTSDLPDYRDQDRLYIAQDMPMYPYVRAPF